jgi:hypothetical protein
MTSSKQKQGRCQLDTVNLARPDEPLALAAGALYQEAPARSRAPPGAGSTPKDSATGRRTGRWAK